MVSLELDVVALQETGRPTAECLAVFAAAGVACLWSPRADTGRPAGGTGFLWRPHRLLPPVTLASSCSGVEFLVAEWRSSVGLSTLRLMTVYAPPHCDARPLPPAAFSSALSCALRNWRPDVALGDFNARHSSWDPYLGSSGGFPAQRGAHLVGDLRALDLRLCAPTMPTRERGGSRSVLDFALVAAECEASVAGVPVACGSDHSLVVFAVSAGGVSPPSFSVPWAPHMRIAWRKVTPEMRRLAGLDVASTLARRGLPGTANSAVAYFTQVVRRCTAGFPRVLPGHHTSVAPAVREALDTADRAWSLVETARQVGRQEFVPSFLAHAKVCTARLEAAIAFACAHPGATAPCYSGSAAWKVFLAVSAPHTPLPPCVGNWTTERAIAEGFADLFAAKSAGTDVVPRRPAAEPPPQVTSAEVQMAIAAFTRGKAGDPDGLDAELLQLLPSDAHLWLAKVFDMCLRTGLPARWKESVVVPVPKPGKPTDQPSSYRPVALTSVLCRTLERIVLGRVLAGRWRLAMTQFGFRPGSSTEDAIAFLAMSLADASSVRTPSLVVGVDMTDAFCRVRPSSFAREYIRLGFPTTYLSFFLDFLSGRSFIVRVGSRASGKRFLELGAPQGSVTGPFFWAVVMDPLCTSLDQHLLTVPGMGPRHHRGVPRNLNHRWCGCLQYADDGVLWLSGADVDQLLRGANDALVLVADFCSREGIALSTKSTALLIGAPSPTTPMSVVCGNLVVEVRTGEVTERVLGAFFDTRLNMTQHVERAVARAHKVLACIASIRRLLSPATTRELVFGAALSPAIYAAAAFGSLLRTTAWHLLDTLVLACARLVTLAVATAPTSAVTAEAGIPPARFLVARRAALLCERIVRRDNRCPLRRLLMTPPQHTTKHVVTLRDSLAAETRRMSPSMLLPLVHPRVLCARYFATIRAASAKPLLLLHSFRQFFTASRHRRPTSCATAMHRSVSPLTTHLACLRVHAPQAGRSPLWLPRHLANLRALSPPKRRPSRCCLKSSLQRAPAQRTGPLWRSSLTPNHALQRSLVVLARRQTRSSSASGSFF